MCESTSVHRAMVLDWLVEQVVTLNEPVNPKITMRFPLQYLRRGGWLQPTMMRTLPRCWPSLPKTPLHD